MNEASPKFLHVLMERSRILSFFDLFCSESDPFSQNGGGLQTLLAPLGYAYANEKRNCLRSKRTDNRAVKTPLSYSHGIKSTEKQLAMGDPLNSFSYLWVFITNFSSYKYGRRSQHLPHTQYSRRRRVDVAFVACGNMRYISGGRFDRQLVACVRHRSHFRLFALTLKFKPR